MHVKDIILSTQFTPKHYPCHHHTHRYTAPKNLALFQRMGVLSEKECAARQQIMFAHYTGVVEVEVSVCFIIIAYFYWLPNAVDVVRTLHFSFLFPFLCFPRLTSVHLSTKCN